MNHTTIIFPSEEVLGEGYLEALKTEFVRQAVTRLRPQSRYETVHDDDVVISRLYLRAKLDENG
jgi:hypothetical protein